jgi:Yip1 domain
MEEQIINQPTMSEPSSLLNIFIEPGRTFESLRIKPKFLMAGLITIIVIMGFQMAFWNKLGTERMKTFITKQMELNPQIQSMAAEEKSKIVDQQMKFSNIGQYLSPVFIGIFFAIGGLIYWLAGNAMGGTGTFLKGLAVWIYSGFPPTVVQMLANIIVLVLKSADDIDPAMSQRGLINANPSFFMDGKSMPVLATLVSTIDLFQIWGWVLAAIGLKIVCKLSTSSAFAIVILLALVNIAFRVVVALVSGNPM